MRVAFVRRLMIPTLLCCTAIDAAAAQQATQQPEQQAIPSYRFRLLGVYDERSGDPIADVKVSDMLSGTSSLTSSTGTVSLMFLPDGGSLVSIKKVGYEPQTLPVSISPSDTLPITLLMQPLPTGQITQLPAVRTIGTAAYISGALRAFQERENRGVSGYFIDDTTLRKNDGQRLADVMRSRMPNANVAEGVHGSTVLLRSPRCMIGGPPQVFLDGVLLTSDAPPPPPPGSKRPPPPSSSIPFDLSRFQVSDLAGVEWYPSSDSAPVEYGGTSERCGVLLLWTRER